MDLGGEYRFETDAYTPETMPMARLARYLEELARVLGEEKYVHLIDLLPGSTVLIHKIDAEATPKVRARAASIRRGEGPAEAMRGYREINRLLREDNGVALLTEKGAEIIRFPGREEERPDFVGVQQQGELDGEVVRVGGMGDPVPITLQVGGQALTGCYAKRNIAKPLGRHLFEPIRVFGTGRWTRSADGLWQLDRFMVDRFEVLDDQPLASVVLALRALRGDEWGTNAITDLLALREDREH